ncbi:hypothetical protein M413DRAFT_29270 [Hebeloma cylindrosporum]|uniref:RRM domain-containing protein n=1 Tax=Hebeloma cylindrosporum TaxID=76867 RepID=A0A0C2YET5_HEBCY|nr:hypothetical protein M413DRAFT_29270 [Hebeloma cylindrosporum h7]
MDAPVTKRLIISGLTPAITADDISRRLTSFGTVKAADGFGLPNGVGETRKFGYVTLETTTGKLAKCMNLLSGSTWKGAKLRFGEAKPDFKERIALENASEEPPKKKRKRFGGIHAEDMTLVSPENAAARPGWKVSSLGRITRPMKMRPEHPLPEVQEPKVPKVKKTTTIDGEKKKKKRLKDPDSRARRRAIDMTKWGSTHLKGVFLDLEVPVGMKKIEPEPAFPGHESDSDSASESSDDEVAAEPTLAHADAVLDSSTSLPMPNSPSVPALPAVSPTAISTKNRKPEPTQPLPKSSNSQPAHDLDANTDIQQEKAQALSLLNNLFGGDDVDDWVGEESVGSDVDVDELTKGDVMLAEEDAAFEVVPRNVAAKTPSRKSQHTSENEEETEGEDEPAEEMEVEIPMEDNTTKGSTSKSTQRSTLKDLFAPREEEAGFSLLGHLDVDIELDDDLPFSIEPPTQQTQQMYHDQVESLTPPPTSVITHASQGTLVLNPKQALFFPISSQDGVGRARQRDAYDVIKDNGWNWRDPAVEFFRTGTEEDIRKRWEESKGELTRDWKRRCREAGKVNRRKRGGVDNDNEY